MIISAIVATDENGVIGKDGQIPWYLPVDLKFFKQKTLGHPIIMGRKSFVSIGRALPGRTNIIVTRNPYFIASGCLVVDSLKSALQLASIQEGKEEVFIIGGGEIYQQSLPIWNRLYWTKVHIKAEGDTFFPKISKEEWDITREDFREKDEKNPMDCTFYTLEKKL
jgi:dihydrofolate reductase